MNHYKTLEFDTILQKLAGLAVSKTVKERCLKLAPARTLQEARRLTDDTSQAKMIIEKTGSPPLSLMTELQKIIDILVTGAMLVPEQIAHVQAFIMSCRRMKDYLKRAEATGADIAFYGGSIIGMTELEDEIVRCIRTDTVDDKASQHLFSLRRSIDNKKEEIRTKLDSILRKNKEYFSEGFAAIRNGRYTLPVKRELKNRIEGSLIELSNSGGTCFIEPAAVRALHDELNGLQVEEDAEVRRILYTLTAMIYDNLPSVNQNIQAMETLDFLFAKGKLSIDMNASPMRLTEEREIRILSGRHPLIDPGNAVPLNFALGGEWMGIVITGPNTGGKTVTLKTAGLLALMAQSGLHVTAAENSSSCLFDGFYCDIGDGQSITENLSTFSSHITNVTSVLRTSTENSLILFDELGSGTDPAEGMGIAAAVLEELRRKNCLFAATTHYPEIKDLAANTPGLINARMAFDKESLMPLYRLEIGAAGESCALYIAERIGMPANLLDRARELSGGKTGYKKAGNYKVNILSVTAANIEEENTEPAPIPRSRRFGIGDSVTVYPKKEIGIVYATADDRGNVGVQIKGQKTAVNHKRLRLKASASELYPDGYDMSIVFDSVENRKARHLMDRKHVDGNVVVIKN